MNQTLENEKLKITVWVEGTSGGGVFSDSRSRSNFSEFKSLSRSNFFKLSEYRSRSDYVDPLIYCDELL